MLTSSDIGVPLPPVGRKLVKLSKEGLMKDAGYDVDEAKDSGAEVSGWSL